MRIKAKLLTLLAAAAIAGTAFAQPQGPGYGAGMMDPGAGPGMMGGYGPGGGRGYGPGYGMGPGMMGGYGPGYGMGPGMMGGPLWALDLTDAQRTQINKIQDDVRRKNWDVMGKMQDELAKLRDAYASGKRDRAAILGAYKRIGELRLQRIENALDAREKIDGVLTKEQREQLRQWGPWWMSGEAE
jgi:Spy/CpxP family protein refolding chaperone